METQDLKINLTEQETPKVSDVGSKEDREIPKDTKMIIYWMYLLYGVGTLLPWQACLNCMEFFINEMPIYQP
jgi:hypothetical protein